MEDTVPISAIFRGLLVEVKYKTAGHETNEWRYDSTLS